MSKKESTDVNEAAVKETVKKKTSTEAFCVYLGPTITGVVQSGTIYRGTKARVLKNLESAVGKYPLIPSLIVTDKTLAEDRVKVKTPGNILYVNYHKLASGKK